MISSQEFEEYAKAHNLCVWTKEKCYLYGSCKCQTAGCVVRPDNGCPVYRYFKGIIVKDYENRLKGDMAAILDKIRSEIVDYGSIWVAYAITGKSDEDIEQLVSDVLSQAKKQVLEIIDKYKAESEE